MKRIILFFLCSIALISISQSQTHNPDFLDGRIMIKLKKEVTPKEKLNRTNQHSFSLKENIFNYPLIKKALLGVNVTSFERPSYYTDKKELMKIYRITFSDFEKIDALIESLSQLENVEFAEKEPLYKTDFVPNDTYHSGNNKWYHTLVKSEAAWNISTGNSNIKVAIVDNAVFTGHADLTTFLQRDVSDNDNDATPPKDYNTDSGWSHGTHCAGLATANINNNNGIASLGGNVELIGVKASPNSGASGTVYDTYDGVQWACSNGANVVSMSFGSTSSSIAFQNLINAYPNVVFLAAAGNDNKTILQYPAAYDNVICVGSVDSDNHRSSFSNYNGTTPFVDVCAPGGHSYGGLLSTVYTSGGNGYAKMGGTSMATPFTAGLVGLMLSVNPTLTPAEIETCLINSGVNINENIGPRIDALAALQCAQATIVVSGDPIPAFTGNPISITEGDNVTFINNSADGGNPITNYTWTFPGGTPGSYVGKTPPAITYNTPGVYDVTLSATNSQNTVLLTKTGYINVGILPYGNWIVQNSGFSTASRGINWISIVDANTVWATPYDGSATAAKNVQEFTKTIDGGANWTTGTINLGNPALGLSMIHALDANTAWLAAYPNASGQTGGVWKTTNGGANWTRQNTALFNNAVSFTNVVYFWNANEGFCQGDPINGEHELYRTTNGGTTWTPVPGGNIPDPIATEFGYTRGIEVAGNNVWFTTNFGRIYHSTDRGIHWSVYQSPITDFGGARDNTSYGKISFKDSNTGLIIDNNSQVYKTTNGGANWAKLTTTGTVFNHGLCMVEGTDTVFSTGNNPAGSSYSTDGGVTWNLIDNQPHLYVDFIDAATGWSGWFSNATTPTIEGMWKWGSISSLVADFQSSPTTVCTTDSIQFNDLSTGGTPTSWLWTFESGSPASSILQNPKVKYTTRGTYDVSLTVNDENGAVSKTVVDYITVEAPTKQPSVIAGNITPCENNVETYSVSKIPIPGTFYTWTLPTTWVGASGSSSIIATVGSVSGNIEVTADNVCGSSVPRTLAVTICTPVSIDELNKNKISIYPNPAQDAIYLIGAYDSEMKNNNIHIVDVVGKTVFSTTINNSNYKINISQLANGLYFIQLNNSSVAYKFIKE